MSHRALLILGLALVVAGSTLAHLVQTAGGDVRVVDVRFVDAGASIMSGLLYVPDGASAQQPAPGVLAVHGYINTRETQSAFAIELARRGYVVLALDQTGHGGSAPPAFAAGFGGPAGLAYLRSLPFVDGANIGLEGHSMGGWAVLHAAAAFPDGYRAVVLQGSAPDVLGAPAGTPVFPRNVAVVFSRWDEFSALMWGVPRAVDARTSAKLKTLFDTPDDVTAGRLYGDVAAGTGRRLTVPATTHPGNHLSTAAVADTIDWFALTLTGGRTVDGQTWWWKELGTLLALVGAVVAMIATGRLLLAVPLFSPLVARTPVALAAPSRLGTAVYAAVPVLTYLPSFVLAERFLSPGTWFPQQIGSAVLLWLVVNALVTLAAARFALPALQRPRDLGRSALLALGTVGTGYGLLAIVDALLGVDFRFWVVAIRPLETWHVPTLLVDLPVLVACFGVAGASAAHYASGDSTPRAVLRLVALTSGGFALLVAVQYAGLFAGGELPLGQPLYTVVAFQFVVLLAIVAVVTAVFLRATGNPWPGALINALFVGWVVVAGTATHVGS